jgi:hypothetical protein
MKKTTLHKKLEEKLCLEELLLKKLKVKRD